MRPLPSSGTDRNDLDADCVTMFVAQCLRGTLPNDGPLWAEVSSTCVGVRRRGCWPLH